MFAGSRDSECDLEIGFGQTEFRQFLFHRLGEFLCGSGSFLLELLGGCDERYLQRLDFSGQFGEFELEGIVRAQGGADSFGGFEDCRDGAAVLALEFVDVGEPLPYLLEARGIFRKRC